MKRKVLLIGWDSADWKIIDKLIEKGQMPAIKRVIDNGTRARFSTLDPPLSPLLWTSMATGKRPFKHGVLGFVETDGVGGVRPITSYGRKVNAFWNIFTKEGLKTNVVGWWPSNPVESINGVMVSNLFQQEKKHGVKQKLKDWEIAPGSVYPESMIENIRDLRVHPSEIHGNMVLPFVPRARELNKKEDKRLNILAKFIAHSTTVHATCTELMETTDWDVMAVYHDALDHFSHGFMKYHPPKLDRVSKEDFELFNNVVTGAYIYHDMMLERLLEMIDDQTTVIICSDHGFQSDHLRPPFIPKTPAGPATEHSPYGIFLAMGPGIKKGETIFGAKILDLTPTLLYMFDLPIGRDMDGKPLISLFEEAREIKYIDTWEDDKRYGGEIVLRDKGADNGSNEMALQQLIELGYIEDFTEGADNKDEAQEKMKQKIFEVLRESNYYLAKSYMSAGKYDEGLEVLLEMEDRNNPELRYLIEIIEAAIKSRRFELAKEYIDYMRVKKIMPPNYLNLLLANVLIGENQPDQALHILESLPTDMQVLEEYRLLYGKLLNALSLTDKAKAVFSKIIENDPQSHVAYMGIGIAAFKEENYELALENFLQSVELLYHNPRAHLFIGETLALMKEYHLALNSFHVVESLAPKTLKTYRWLSDLYSILGDNNQAKKYDDILKSKGHGEKKIITGLPGERLLQMIEDIKNMGLSISYDENDILRSTLNVIQKGWLKKIEENVIYIPLHLLPNLPPLYSYRILFVDEDFEEVMAYINKLRRIKKHSYNLEVLEGLRRMDRVARSWMDQQPSLDIIYISNTNDQNNVLLKQFLSSR